MELFHGSPADAAGRNDREIRAYALLDRLGVSFDRTDHPEQPATTMEVCAEVDAVLGLAGEDLALHPLQGLLVPFQPGQVRRDDLLQKVVEEALQTRAAPALAERHRHGELGGQAAAVDKDDAAGAAEAVPVQHSIRRGNVQEKSGSARGDPVRKMACSARGIRDIIIL